MNKVLTLLVLFFCLNNFGQQLYLNVAAKTENQVKVIDSIGYLKSHVDAKSIVEETNLLLDKLQKSGFLDSEIEKTEKLNDSTFAYLYNIGVKTNWIHIYIDKNIEEADLSFYSIKNDTLVLPIAQSEAFLKEILNKLERKGFSMAKVKLDNFQKLHSVLTADLIIDYDKKRILNDIVINGYTNFPKSHVVNLKRIYKKQTFNQDNLNKLYKNIEKFRFVKQTKYPEVLFTKDSTKAYVYLEKSKANSFDGFIGFSNDDQQKLIFNGYLDVSLQNILNSGEKLALYWKSNGKDQKTFNLGVELPYIFKSPLGLKAQLNIFKQDSTFQNTQTAIDLGYFFNYNSRLYLGYQSTESSDIGNLNTNLLSDYNNSFITTTYEFTDFSDDLLFPEKSNYILKIGTGSRTSKFQNNKQFFGSINLKHNFYLNDKNYFNVKLQNFYLQSDEYITNELYRFGGINSIRGFNENSLQGNLFSSILTEYRYVLSPSIYVHSIIDYGYFSDKTTNLNGNLLGLGFGFGLLTKNGLFNLVYANGSTKDQAIKLSNSIVHISLKATF